MDEDLDEDEECAPVLLVGTIIIGIILYFGK